MDETLLERFIQQYLLSQTQPQVSFTWHGGEPLLRPISFYEKALKLQQSMAKDMIFKIAYKPMEPL